ncbi:archaeosortase D [Methanocaldococcus sp. 28A]
MDNKRYLLNFFILLVLIYLFLKNFEIEIAKILTIIIGNLLKIPYFENKLIYNKEIFSINPACTCSFEIALFLAYVLATPKVPIKYKLTYSIIGMLIINITNILRIIFILKNSYLTNYKIIHNLISFIIFPVALILNLIWVKILLKIGVVKQNK